MTAEMTVLLVTAAGLGVTHTAIGVDHTLPFILIGRARHWSLVRTLAVTFGCGLAHVLSSVLVGTLGVALGVGLSTLEVFEASRGHWASWMLVVFGVAYALFSVGRLRHGASHQHLHVHADGTLHSHGHDHPQTTGAFVHMHSHAAGEVGSGSAPLQPAATRSGVSLSLFLVFLVGPCEVLLPLMAAPALGGRTGASLAVALAFGTATVATMLVMVTAGFLGLRGEWLTRVEPHLNWVAGVTIALSGLGIVLFGI